MQKADVKPTRLITIPAGIGDQIWIFQKLLSTGERYIFRSPDGEPQRSHQIHPLLPQLSAKHYYDRFTRPTKTTKAANIQRTLKLWSQIVAGGYTDFYLEANSHVEAGHKLEGFLPDLDTHYKIDYHTTRENKAEAAAYIPDITARRYVGIYTSSDRGYYENPKTGLLEPDPWRLPEWISFIQMFKDEYDPVFVLIGADWDVNLTEPLRDQLNYLNIENIYLKMIDYGSLIEVMKRLDYFLGFPSGNMIVNETLGRDGLMFYTKTIAGQSGIINTWADPARIKNGNIKECLFDTPETIFNWFKYNHNLKMSE